ncbi:hypothetical protein HPB49_018348 [Dermacentor silvarum]|uniref:Uncharacterized protein n=1 Tax=Dermacentor silvarum TaxID=543639 RepID=A0ACB8CAK5_DERSI|nr:hypothetical protein HPB49_018348 [Dermacentor silvarum]
MLNRPPFIAGYGEDCVSDKSVPWTSPWTSARIRAGCESLVNDPRPGQANTVITADLIDKVDDRVRSDRRVTLGMLRYGKVCAQWVPKQLTDQHKELRMGLALRHLFRYHEDPAFLERIVTGDESWCEPETKRDSM